MSDAKVTVELTREQASALEWIASFGVDEKRYQLEEPMNDYSDEDIAAAQASLIRADDAIGLLQCALSGKRTSAPMAERAPMYGDMSFASQRRKD